MIDLILDTNIWISHIAKNKPEGIFEILKSQVDSGEVYLLTNEIILDEWERNKQNTIKEIEGSIKTASKSALKIKSFLESEDRQKLEEILEKYNSKEKERIDLARERIAKIEQLMTSATVVKVTDEMKVKVANWALEKRAPFTQKKNSVGDALILLSAVEHRLGYREHGFIPLGFFITYNHTDYANANSVDEIHDDLQELLEEGNMTYKRNIGEVLNLTPDINMEIESYIDMQIESYMEEQREMARGK